LLAFAGYFVMAAQGWPAPLDAMRLERGVIGGLILTLGLLCAVATCLPEPKRANHAPEPIDKSPS
jgi:hypothetical protein